MSDSEKAGRAMKIVAIAQARMGSTRVPGKVMRDLGGIPVLQWTISALRSAQGIDEIVLATSTAPADDEIEHYCKLHSINCFRGSEDDVVDRYYQAAKQYKADIILRLTCDCPFLDPAVISEVVKLREMTNADYASNTEPPTYPDGLDTECFTFRALEAAHGETSRRLDRDCVTQFIIRNRSRFPAVNLTCPLPGLRKERWVLDTEDDYKFCVAVEKRLTKLANPSYLDILNVLDREPELRKLNNAGVRNERFYEGLAAEPPAPRRYRRSCAELERALSIIPFGAQTFSKSHLQFPVGKAPLYVTHADGARIFDVDGNDYVDLVNALLPVVLGYRDPDVDLAIRRQLDCGISFSLATELEVKLAEKLVGIIPCAEMVKFGKSGTDVTSAAIRLARAYTGRDHILLAGYHGWADWSMSASDRYLGIPRDVRELSHRIEYGGHLDEGWHWRITPKQTAAIIVEPNGDPEYLRRLRRFCDHNGIVLIFDEIITGFRYALGGAQELYGVTPDLACFGKSMANGMPISALVGREDIMKLCAPPNNIFYSGTFFGETLSIAAAIATIEKMERENVITQLWHHGSIVLHDLNVMIKEHDLGSVIKLSGVEPRSVIEFKDSNRAKAENLKALFISRMADNGVLVINSNNMSFAHKMPEVTKIVNAYDQTLADIAKAIRDGSIHNVEPITTAPLRAAAG